MSYTYQQGEGGIADALRLAEHFADQGPVCVVLGDNLIQGNIAKATTEFRAQKTGAKIFAQRGQGSPAIRRAVLEGNRVVKIEEKPAQPKSSYVTGIYFYDAKVFDIVRTLKPSGRGELEITDVNNAYIERGELTWERA
ncbi:MAG: sugar phosphate nucleotidyltransferase [Nitrospiraceae bacterium]